MRAWITKYALTQGIFTVEAEDNIREEILVVRHLGYIPDCYHGEGREWHRTPESAMARAEQMRKAKIASLEKQIKKLQTMKFVLPDIDQRPEKE